MKFGQLLQQRCSIFPPEVSEKVLNYKHLKKSISNFTKSRAAGADVDAVQFLEDWMILFRREVHKFNAYFVEAADEEEFNVAQYEADHKHKKPVPRADVKESYIAAQELKFFVELNKVAARKILKKLVKNFPEHDAMLWYTQEGLELPAFQDTMYPIIRRLVAIHAHMFHDGKCNLAEMELDYSTSCSSEVLSYLMEVEDLHAMPDLSSVPHFYASQSASVNT
eukprot:TRINITY_DN2452_c0_g1_i1.p1 TRINITY_DN2452_c0_g1~~TRINITY_DN2452_c0_g1_i1.p1  ORF type:complete len:223 (+),score=63.26 TRINITY_DN2452_c0_g1_i1:66-734(+)